MRDIGCARWYLFFVHLEQYTIDAFTHPHILRRALFVSTVVKKRLAPFINHKARRTAFPFRSSYRQTRFGSVP